MSCFKKSFWHYVEGLRSIMKTYHGSWHLGWDSNFLPPKYNAGFILQHFVVFLFTNFVIASSYWSFSGLLAENCTPLGYFAVCSGNSVLTVWDNLLVPSSKVKKPRIRMSVRNYHYSLQNVWEGCGSHLLHDASWRKLEIMQSVSLSGNSSPCVESRHTLPCSEALPLDTVLTPWLFKIHFNIILLSVSRSHVVSSHHVFWW